MIKRACRMNGTSEIEKTSQFKIKHGLEWGGFVKVVDANFFFLAKHKKRHMQEKGVQSSQSSKNVTLSDRDAWANLVIWIKWQPCYLLHGSVCVAWLCCVVLFILVKATGHGYQEAGIHITLAKTGSPRRR